MKAVPDGEHATTPPCVSARAAMATSLIVAAIAALAITSLIHGNERAAAQAHLVQPAPSMMVLPLSVPLDSGELGPFAFGHLEFDWDPAAGVPGFSSWPSGSPSR